MEMAKNSSEYIQFLLAKNDIAVERAIVAIYRRQTRDERDSNSTIEPNGIGFSGTDARLGSYYAKWVLSGKNLSGQHLIKARNMAYKYTRQLVEIATQKMEAEKAYVDSERASIQSV